MAATRLLVMREELRSGRGASPRMRGRRASPRGGLRLLDAASLHLTLCFLGSRPVGEIDALATALAACDEHAVELSVGAPLWLPPRGPHALAVEVHDHAGELARVQERVAGALSSVSAWRPERRRFRAHIRSRACDGASPARVGAASAPIAHAPIARSASWRCRQRRGSALRLRRSSCTALG